MYRVFCESYYNYINQNRCESTDDWYRLRIAEPLRLISNPKIYQTEKECGTAIYKQLSDLLVYMENNLDRYPKLRAFLWTLESRRIKGEFFGLARQVDLEEQTKLVNMFLGLLYWDEIKS